ncbi:hypothetical protein A2159_03475 [Candidatus Woesebacteria bacterium RBG_13_34_9]|uniref:DUF5673 domain-containing protein n=1 Tax=Candidatus Woesebacteria bacterium RBG_13_34_9 TaxID=1802477 RepID=A0A1F7X629_9BACT|nr:MAG: hypothetical protein A2159_03475 [Candidatus Woesebacteria bacterium RBG_13_34_9]
MPEDISLPATTDSIQEKKVNVQNETEKEIFKWSAPTRVTIKKTKEFWVRGLVTISIFGLILFIAEGVMPVILLISIAFLIYVLAMIEPQKAEYAITNKGIRISGNLNVWDFFTNYWITTRFSRKMIIFGTVSLPGSLEIIIDEKDEEKIKTSLVNYLKEEEIQMSNLGKLSNWIYSKLIGL